MAELLGILKRAGRSALADQITDSAAALAYYTFLAIPATLLVAVGIFGLVASPGDVASLLSHLQGTVPKDALDLVRKSLTRITKSGGGSVAAVVVGFLLALWTLSGAVNALMRAVNSAYGRRETRGFVRQRLTTLAIIACMVVAVALVVGLLVLGPVLSGRVGDALGIQSAMGWIWWTAQWPILLVGLLAVFAAIYVLAPDVEHRRLEVLAPGTVLAVVVWLAASGAFSVYVATFASYNKTWGSLAAVIVLLTWLWLTGVALLLGAEVNAEAARSREPRPAAPAPAAVTRAARPVGPLALATLVALALWVFRRGSSE